MTSQWQSEFYSRMHALEEGEQQSSMLADPRAGGPGGLPSMESHRWILQTYSSSNASFYWISPPKKWLPKITIFPALCSGNLGKLRPLCPEALELEPGASVTQSVSFPSLYQKCFCVNLFDSNEGRKDIF